MTFRLLQHTSSELTVWILLLLPCTVTSEDVFWSIRNVKLKVIFFPLCVLLTLSPQFACYFLLTTSKSKETVQRLDALTTFLTEEGIWKAELGNCSLLLFDGNEEILTLCIVTSYCWITEPNVGCSPYKQGIQKKDWMKALTIELHQFRKVKGTCVGRNQIDDEINMHVKWYHYFTSWRAPVESISIYLLVLIFQYLLIP